ncbi:hypothetical protein HAX54_001642 [Datura stramonium]|uniref:Uncharacterized protein n=1 Tax=Datura stramonium TaxID=4076 RepID=A0ABS8T2P2_DATST|nr:hypothetical protein [Datura stramonium]
MRSRVKIGLLDDGRNAQLSTWSLLRGCFCIESFLPLIGPRRPLTNATACLLISLILTISAGLDATFCGSTAWTLEKIQVIQRAGASRTLKLKLQLTGDDKRTDNIKVKN